MPPPSNGPLSCARLAGSPTAHNIAHEIDLAAHKLRRYSCRSLSERAIPSSDRRILAAARRRSAAAAERAPCFQLLRRDRSNPSGVFGPLLGPPCILQRPFAIAADLQGSPDLVRAPQRGAELGSPGGLPCRSQPLGPIMAGRDVSRSSVTFEPFPYEMYPSSGPSSSS